MVKNKEGHTVINADTYNEAEIRVNRLFDRDPSKVVEVYVGSKLAYIVSTYVPKFKKTKCKTR